MYNALAVKITDSIFKLRSDPSSFLEVHPINMTGGGKHPILTQFQFLCPVQAGQLVMEVETQKIRK